MKDYHEYPKQFIGSSDIASLTIRTPLECRVLNFGCDGDYYAYLVDKDAEIGSHYEKIMTVKDWMWIYSDLERVCKIEGDEINIYRSGLQGCIIQTLNKDDEKDQPVIKDSNGVTIKENYVVRIKDAWSNNGLWVVTNVYVYQRDGKVELSLHKLRKRDMRKSDSGAGNTIDWPLRCYSNDWKKCEEIDTYNREHAKIEVVSNEYVEPEAKPVSDDIKIMKRGIRKGNDYCSCYYYKNNDMSVTIDARHYNQHIPREIGNVKNESDGMTDYFETDSCVLRPGDKFYEKVLSFCS
jgi:hypothetical protein